jgi:hypothetical protein
MADGRLQEPSPVRVVEHKEGDIGGYTQASILDGGQRAHCEECVRDKECGGAVGEIQQFLSGTESALDVSRHLLLAGFEECKARRAAS